MDDFTEITNAAELTPGPGHNISGAPLDQLLAEETVDLAKRRDELLAAVARAPETIEDEDWSGKVSDVVRMITACTKAAETARTGRTEPFLAAQRLIMAHFKRITDPLATAKTLLERKLTAYQRVKAENERRAREAAARAAAEAAAKAQREADEALAIAAALQAPTPQAVDAALDNAVSAQGVADHAAGDAVQAQKAAEVKPAELSRTRGEYGAVASLHTFWDFADLDREDLSLSDLGALRAHLPLDAIEKAVRSFIRAGGRRLDCCKIFENIRTAVR